jgi:hypothetical protein
MAIHTADTLRQPAYTHDSSPPPEGTGNGFLASTAHVTDLPDTLDLQGESEPGTSFRAALRAARLSRAPGGPAARMARMAAHVDEELAWFRVAQPGQ